MPKRGKVSTDFVAAYGVDNSNENSETEAQDAGKLHTGTVCSRTQRKLRREQCSIEEDKQLRNMNLLEDGMTNKMKSDMLKAVFASKESALAEDMRRTSITASDSEEKIIVSSSLEISDSSQPLSNGTQDHPNATPIGTSKQTEAHSNGKKGGKLAGEDEQENKSGLQMKPMFAKDGVDPDEYAQVIMAELTHHHEQLYIMQRRSLNLLEWGPPIIGSTAAAVASQLDQNGDNVCDVSQKPTSRWLSTKTTKNPPQLSHVDEEEIFEINSPTSDESSQEEFLIGRKSKQAKKVVKRNALKKAKPLSKKVQQQPDVEGEASEVVVQKQYLPMKRKGTTEKDDKSKVKLAKSVDFFSFTEDEASDEEAAATTSSERSTASFRAFPRRDSRVRKTAMKEDQVPEADKVACPLCGEQFSKDIVEEHASDCIGSAQGDSTSVTEKCSKNVDFTYKRCCCVCGDYFAMNVLDDHVAVCSLEDKMKRSNDPSTNTSASTSRGTKPDQFYAQNRATGITSPFDTFRRSRGGLR